MTAAVAGASGYAGGELLRLLLAHPDLELGAARRRQQRGAPVTDLHPQLPQLVDRVFAATDPARLASADVVFLALPHGQWPRSPPRCRPTAVVDLGADHRLASADDWARFYDTPYAGQWPYGLPELFRGDLVGARRIAGPGCNATAMTLALGPLLTAGLVDPLDVVDADHRGTSGAGRAPSPSQLASEVMGDTSRVQGRSAPAHPRGPAEPAAARRHRRDAHLHPDAGPDAPRDPRHGHRPHHRVRRGTAGRPARGVRRGALRARAARGPLAPSPPRPPARTRASCRSRSTPTAAARSSWRRWTTSARAPPARRCSAPTSLSGCPRPPACRRPGSCREVSAPQASEGSS